MKELSEEQERILVILHERGKLGIRQLMDEDNRLNQRVLYKNLKELRQLRLVEEEDDGYRKLHSLTKKGERKAKGLWTTRRINKKSQDFLSAKETRKKLSIFKEIFEEFFKAFYPEKWNLKGSEEWERFRSIIELVVKEHLNKNLPSKDVILENCYQEYVDAYFVLRDVDGYRLLKDALLAKELGHYLTENHRDILLKTKTVSSSEELEEHNNEWYKWHSDPKDRKDRFREEETKRNEVFTLDDLEPLKRIEEVRWARDNLTSKQ